MMNEENERVAVFGLFALCLHFSALIVFTITLDANLVGSLYFVGLCIAVTLFIWALYPRRISGVTQT